MTSWPVQDAKARFSELLETCLRDGPQVVTRRGAEAAVLVPVDEWRRLQRAAKPTLKELLLSDRARAILPCRNAAGSAAERRRRLPDMYLLDTNVVSELRRARPHGAVLAWLRRVPDADLHLSAVTVGEIQAGIEIAREQDEARASELESCCTMWSRPSTS